MNEKEIKREIKSMIADMLQNDKDIREHDLLYKRSDDWEGAKKEVKDDMNSLLSKIENDDYEEGVKEIDKVILSLKNWQKKINKQLG